MAILSIICVIGVGVFIFTVNSVREPDFERMTEEELIDAVVADDFFANLMLHSNNETAVQLFSQKSEALSELLTRDNAEQALLSAIQIRELTFFSAIQTRDPTEIEMERVGLSIILNYVRTQKGAEVLNCRFKY